MNRSARILFFLLFPSLLFAGSDEQQKAHKIVNKLTAIAIDPAGKRAVSLALSQYLSVGREELAQRRHAMNLNYGEIFVVYELVRGGAKIEDIAASMKTGKTLWQAAQEIHADWKQIASEAKKVSGKVDNNLLAHFTNKKSGVEKDHADGYDPSRDTVKADSEVTQHEIDEAQQRYMFLHDHAWVVSANGIDTATERAAGTFLPDKTKAENRPGAETMSNPPPH
jgi:hypothetical protein